tara:strand:- start:503 stop:1834 length:1332 start_codon:yes stop_codon:yes gene_type:complete
MSRTPGTTDFSTAKNASINTILAEEANRIGSDVHKQMLHTSPWIDLIKKSAFPEGMGYQLTTLIYDRSLPTKKADGAGPGLNWNDVATAQTDANSLLGVSNLGQPLKGAAEQVQGANGPEVTGDDGRNYINFSKKLRSYKINRAVIESPRINIDDLRYAAHRQEQLRAVIDNLSEATRHSWAERYRDEFDRLSDVLVVCKAGTQFFAGNGDVTTLTSGTAGGDTISGGSQLTASNISNAVLDKIYFQLIRKGAGREAYGRENGRPVFGLVCSSEASYSLMTEGEFRDDVRYNNSAVSELIKPLGIERSFRGFYHLVDDLAPRYTDGSSGAITKVEPYTVSGGITTVNGAYDSAEYEVAFVIHPEVYECQIPQPFTGTAGLTFDPVNYSGDFKWTNIQSEHANPDGTIGFFRGILACASKPIKTEFGYAILFKRPATGVAAATV